MQTNASASVQGLVIAEQGVLAEAQDVFSRMGAPVEAATFDSIRAFDAFRKRSSESYGFIVLYVRDVVPEEFSAALRNIKHVRNHRLLLYVPHHGTNLAFNIGLTVGREWGKQAEIASNIREARQLLKSWDVTVSDPPFARKGTDLFDVRKRLGLTQDEMASALNVTTRTLQNWERNIGTSQMERKSRDLWELIDLMDDYVVAREENDWLNTANPTFKNKKPIEVIVEGKLRDLIVEFQRLREGQPL
jgi:DNA-binding transcriptional regulator YiaG